MAGSSLCDVQGSDRSTPSEKSKGCPDSTAGALCVRSEMRPIITSEWLTSRGGVCCFNGITPAPHDTCGRAIGECLPSIVTMFAVNTPALDGPRSGVYAE